MSSWTKFRDKLTMMLVQYGLAKATNPKTSWVDTREEIKATAAEEAVNQIGKKIK